ncbi:hypothetical protein [Paraburkholderia sp. SIMBA_054]|uniref:hypothetical protein n=1 Tax=Paraburkholderia sp. SIMBA_054 TaxID=3085795 RepID=UPI003977F428
MVSTAGLATDCLGQGVTKTDADAPGVTFILDARGSNSNRNATGADPDDCWSAR